MKELIGEVLGNVTEIFEMSAIMGYPTRDYAENEPLALAHEGLEGGKCFDVLSFHRGSAEAIAFLHSDGWGSLSLRWQDCFYEYAISAGSVRLTQCVNPSREADALAWLNTELAVELAMFFRVDTELLEESDSPIERQPQTESASKVA